MFVEGTCVITKTDSVAGMIALHTHTTHASTSVRTIKDNNSFEHVYTTQHCSVQCAVLVGCMWVFITFTYIVTMAGTHHYPIICRCAGARKGFLYKRKKGSNEWQRRWFKLDHDTFSYYITTDVRTMNHRNLNKTHIENL